MIVLYNVQAQSVKMQLKEDVLSEFWLPFDQLKSRF